MNCGTLYYNLCIPQGATYKRVFVWSAGNPCCGLTTGVNPKPVDLVGYTAALQIKAYALATTVLYDAGAAGDLALGGVNGTITLTVDSTDTENFTWWSGVYDLLLTSPQGVVTRLASGTVEVCPGVTVSSFNVVTDSSGNPVTDSSGNTVTSS